MVYKLCFYEAVISENKKIWKHLQTKLKPPLRERLLKAGLLNVAWEGPGLVLLCWGEYLRLQTLSGFQLTGGLHAVGRVLSWEGRKLD